MQNRPTTTELLDAVRGFLEREILPLARDGGPHFRVLVAMNLLRIAARDDALERPLMEAQWRRLNRRTGLDLSPPPDDTALRAALLERRRALVADIRAGRVDAALRADLEQDVREALRIANPGYLAAFEPV